MSSKNKNKRSLSAPKMTKSHNELINSISANIRQLTPEEYKFFFKKYIHNKNGIKIQSESETDSTFDQIQEGNYELNLIYLSNLNNLNNFLQKSINWRGITLKGNKLLENISLNKFNEFFREYGKKIEKKLKRRVLKFFYPFNNKPKLMGPKMNLTPIPIKRNIYFKNDKEKKEYKSAERAAVILRRLEYTYGLGDKKNIDNKILFYLMKGAAITIEDWWINIYKNKKKKDNYNILLSKLNDSSSNNSNKKIRKENKDSYNKYNNNNNYKNKFVFKKKINQKSSYNSNSNTKNKLENKINQNMQRIDSIKKSNMNKLKKNKIEIIEINLNDEQIKDNKSHYTIQTESRKSAPLNNYSSKNNTNKIKKINKIKKTSSAKNIYGNNYRYEIKIDKGKKIKPNPIRLIVSTENKNKDNMNDKIINERLNNLKKAIKNISSDAFNYHTNLPISNRFSDLISNKKKGIKKLSFQKKYKFSSNKKEKTETDIINNNINLSSINTNKNKNKLFSKEYDTSKSHNIPNEKEKNKFKKNKVTSQPKMKLKIENDDFLPNKKIMEKNNNINKFDIDRKELIIEKNNNINIFDINKNELEKENNLDKNKRELKLVIENNINLLISNDQYNSGIGGNKNNIIKVNNDINNENDEKNKSINVISIIGYRLKDEEINNDANNNENNKIEVNDLNDIMDNNKVKDINEINNFNKNKERLSDINKNINEEKIPSDINNKSENESNKSNNILINIKESNKEEKDIKNLKQNIKTKVINIDNNNNSKLINNSFKEEKNRSNIFNSQLSNKENDINKISNNEEIKDSKNNSQEISEESFRFNKNSFFFNNSNNVLLVNIDNNTDYDETEIKRIGKKKNFYERYTTNIIKININNTDYNIINKKEQEKNNCLTEKNKIDLNQEKEKQSAFDENIINSKKDSKSSRQDKNSHKIKYQIIQNNKPFPAMEKTSFDDSVDEIISNQLIKIHNNNDEKIKQRIDKAYNKAQLKKIPNSERIEIKNDIDSKQE